MHIAIIFLAFYYLYTKYFQFFNNQNETSEDLHNTSTVPPSCFQRTNSNHSDVTTNSYQVILESLSRLNRNVSLSLPAFWEKKPIAWFKCVDVFLLLSVFVSKAKCSTMCLNVYRLNIWRH